MATARIYCTEARRWNWQDSAWDTFNGSFSGYRNLGLIGYIPQYTDGSSTAGVCMLSFDALPDGAVISSATLVLKSVRFNGSATHNVRLRISDTYEAYSTTAPSEYQSASIPFTTTLTDRSIDITAQMQDYATAGAACYLYAYETSPSSGDYNNDYMQGIVDSTPYIDITYTVPATSDTVGRWNGSAWENCEVYRYNGSTWELCDVFRYDGTQFVECSTT